MNLTADYHTHTPYSHGKNTIAENVLRAKELGLAEIGITDHGFSHRLYGIDRKKINEYVKECKEAQKKYGVRVFVGVEANILGIDGKTDLDEKDYDRFELFIAGKHVNVKYSTFNDTTHYFWGNLIKDKFGFKPSETLVKYNTKAYINTIKNNPVDIISHLCHRCPADVSEVAKCAADYGTYIELNSSKEHLTDDQLDAMLQTNVRFVIGSDAHSAEKIGDVARTDRQLARMGFPLERIDNIDDRLPAFRFSAFKEGKRL